MNWHSVPENNRKEMASKEKRGRERRRQDTEDSIQKAEDGMMEYWNNGERRRRNREPKGKGNHESTKV